MAGSKAFFHRNSVLVRFSKVSTAYIEYTSDINKSSQGSGKR